MNTFFVVIPKVRKLQFGMTITINNKTLEVAGNEALQQIVFHHTGENTKGIAVAVNGQVIPKDLWAETEVKENDEVLIIKATQGG
ncbi:Sulfur carrier protein ThiS [compost metagenome]